MIKYFKAQCFALFLGTTIGVIFFSEGEAISFVLGFISILLPNVFFALNLFTLSYTKCTPPLRLLFFFGGEGIKVIVTFLLIFLFSKFIDSDNWPIMLVGIFASLKSIYLIPLIKNTKK